MVCPIKLKIQFYAKGQIQKALNSGRIKKPRRCEICDKERRLDGHHEDYRKPLKIQWLCRVCHHKLHYPTHRHNITQILKRLRQQRAETRYLYGSNHFGMAILNINIFDTDEDIAFDRNQTFDRCTRMMSTSNQSIFGRLHNYA